jgi:hypothetical protein
MSLAPEKLSAIRGASVIVLAFLLLLSPVCGAFCQAQMCDTPKAGAENSSCHESFTAAANSSISHVSSIQNCALQQQPVALPVGFRSISSDSPLVASTGHSASPAATTAMDFLYENYFSLRFSTSGESRSLGGFLEHSSLVLRI